MRRGYQFNAIKYRYLSVLSPIKCNNNITKQEPLRLCTFSRVMKEKGIEDAVNAVEAVNEYFGRLVYTLDIWSGRF